MSFTGELTKTLKRYFISGVLVVVPIILTYLVLKFLFLSLDSILQPLLHDLLGYYIPGLGIFSTLLLILLTGVLTRNIIGARLYRFGDKILNRLPIIRPIYSSAKQLLTAIAEPSVSSFQEVALIEYPRKGIYALTFVSHRIKMVENDRTENLVAVFVPSTPTPISGMVILLPEKEIRILDITPEQGIKFLVSGGVASPDIFTFKKEKPLNFSKEDR